MKTTLLTVLLLCIPVALHGQSFAIKANAGTMGIGVEAAVQLHEKVNVRAGGNFFSFSHLYETDDGDEFDVDAELNLSMFSALIDWHPFASGLRLTGGLVYNNNTMGAGLLPKQEYTVGGDVYGPDELGALDAEFTFNSIAPYLALGFGNPFSGSRFGMNMDIGWIFQGSPDVTMKAEGLLKPSAEQAPQLQENMSWWTGYPVLTLSFYYRIN
jgi:hypothetical protein